MLGELNSKTLLCVRNPLHGGQWNLKLAIAKSADSNGGNGAQPFDNPKIAFWHVQPFRRHAGGFLLLAARNFYDRCLRRGRVRLFVDPSPCWAEKISELVGSVRYITYCRRTARWRIAGRIRRSVLILTSFVPREGGNMNEFGSHASRA